MATVTKTKSTSPVSVADAIAEAEEAAALVEALEERIRTGDTSVTPAELENARQLASFATQLVEGAEHRAHKAKVDAATKALHSTAAALADTVTSDKPLLKVRTELTDAIRAYIAASDAHATRVSEALAKFTDARFEAVDLQIDTSIENLGVDVEGTAVYTIREEDGARQPHLFQHMADVTEQLRAALEPAGLTLEGRIQR